MNLVNTLLLLASIVLFFAFALISRRHGKNQDAVNRRFLDEEQAANTSRRRTIEPEMYFEPDLSILPDIDDGDPHSVLRAARRKMLRFYEPLSNLELKKKYGVAQLEAITLQEDNFHDFLKCLGEWAAALREEGRPADALKILAYAIGLGSEFRGTYKLAAEIFGERRDARSLEQLLQAVRDNHFTDGTVQENLAAYIEDRIAELLQ